MISKGQCEQVLARALSRGGTFAEIFFEDSKNFGMTLRSGRIEDAAVSRPCAAHQAPQKSRHTRRNRSHAAQLKH